MLFPDVLLLPGVTLWPESGSCLGFYRRSCSDLSNVFAERRFHKLTPPSLSAEKATHAFFPWTCQNILAPGSGVGMVSLEVLISWKVFSCQICPPHSRHHLSPPPCPHCVKELWHAGGIWQGLVEDAQLTVNPLDVSCHHIILAGNLWQDVGPGKPRPHGSPHQGVRILVWGEGEVGSSPVLVWCWTYSLCCWTYSSGFVTSSKSRPCHPQLSINVLWRNPINIIWIKTLGSVKASSWAQLWSPHTWFANSCSLSPSVLITMQCNGGLLPALNSQLLANECLYHSS